MNFQLQYVVVCIFVDLWAKKFLYFFFPRNLQIIGESIGFAQNIWQIMSQHPYHLLQVFIEEI